MKIERGVWLKDNDPRHYERYLRVDNTDGHKAQCTSVQDVKAGHGPFKKDVKSRQTVISLDRIYEGNCKSGYSLAKPPRWARKLIHPAR